MSLRLSGEPAWILHRRPLRETSCLLDLLCPSLGWISAVARGAAQGRRAAELQPFCPLAVDLVRRGGSEALAPRTTTTKLATLAAYEPRGGRLMLKGTALWSGFYLNELLLRLVPPDAGDATWFAIYSETVAALGSGAHLAACLRQFEYRLLEQLGLSLDAVMLAQADQQERFCWDSEHGLRPHRDGTPAAAIRAVIGGGDAVLIAQTQPLLATMLASQLGDRPLRSAVMLRDLVGLRRRQSARVPQQESTLTP